MHVLRGDPARLNCAQTRQSAGLPSRPVSWRQHSCQRFVPAHHRNVGRHNNSSVSAGPQVDSEGWPIRESSSDLGRTQEVVQVRLLARLPTALRDQHGMRRHGGLNMVDLQSLAPHATLATLAVLIDATCVFSVVCRLQLVNQRQVDWSSFARRKAPLRLLALQEWHC